MEEMRQDGMIDLKVTLSPGAKLEEVKQQIVNIIEAYERGELEDFYDF